MVIIWIMKTVEPLEDPDQSVASSVEPLQKIQMLTGSSALGGMGAALAAEQAQLLSSLETSHVQAVLQSAIDKLALMSVILVDPSMQAQELTKSVGEEISRMITHQKQLEHRFQELIAAQPALRSLANKASLHNNQAELREVSAELKQATKQLCRNLRDNPNLTENMAKVSAQREALQVLYSNTIDALLLQGTVQPVIEAVLAAEQSEAHVRELVEAEKNATSLVKALRSDLAMEKATHDQQIKDKRRALMALKGQLQQEKLQLAVDASYYAQELAANNQTHKRLQEAELQRMQQTLQLLGQQLELEGAVRSATVSCLGAKAASLQDASLTWHSKREDDAQNKEREIEALRAAHNRSLEVLAEAEARLREETAAKGVRDAKLQQEAEDRAAAAALAAKQLAAVVKIQAAWRGFQARQMAKGEKSKPNKKAVGKTKKSKK